MDRMRESMRRAETTWGAVFYVMLLFCFLTVLSLACSLFSFGIVLELQPGWKVWSVFYSYMVAFPLLGIGILAYFLVVYVKRRDNGSKATLYAVTIPYILIVSAIFFYLIYDVVVNCSQNNDAYCWTGLAIRWQYWWMFWSIALQWLFVILQIIFTSQIVNAAQLNQFGDALQETSNTRPVTKPLTAPKRPTVVVQGIPVNYANPNHQVVGQLFANEILKSNHDKLV